MNAPLDASAFDPFGRMLETNRLRTEAQQPVAFADGEDRAHGHHRAPDPLRRARSRGVGGVFRFTFP
jgi:hypothetical protein